MSLPLYDPFQGSCGAPLRDPGAPQKVVFCCPTIKKPYPQFMASLEAEIPLITEAGYDESAVYEIGNVYISHARSIMLRKALDAKADIIVFLDHDLSWKKGDLLKLIQTEGPVIAGTYRFKNPDGDIHYMGKIGVEVNSVKPIQRDDGCIRALCAPAGFLKVTRWAINKFIEWYPDFCYGERCSPHVDLFHHGAEDWIWWGEDYAFTRHWNAAGGEVWIRPDLDIDHWNDGERFKGNFLEYLRRQPGGDKAGQPYLGG